MSSNRHAREDERAVLNIIVKVTGTQNLAIVMHLVTFMQLKCLNKKGTFYTCGISEVGVWVSLLCHTKPYLEPKSKNKKSITLADLVFKMCTMFIMDFLALILFFIMLH